MHGWIRRLVSVFRHDPARPASHTDASRLQVVGLSVAGIEVATTVADDVLEAVDDYLSTDSRNGPYSLAPEGHKARGERIQRLTGLRDRLAAAHEARTAKG